jgi:hypothetical protein
MDFEVIKGCKGAVSRSGGHQAEEGQRVVEGTEGHRGYMFAITVEGGLRK